MVRHALTEFIVRYKEECDAESKYTLTGWIDNAARDSKALFLATHILKYSHSQADTAVVSGSVWFSGRPNQVLDQCYVSSASSGELNADFAVGNAAKLKIAGLLNTPAGGERLLDCLLRGDVSPLAPLAQSSQQLTAWVDGFLQALHNQPSASHSLGKQIYFPVASHYHLLSPLFSSSLCHALNQRILNQRFSEAAKACYERKPHQDTFISYPSTAMQNFGGTKPQNISLLNSRRSGRALLLNCAPPQWQQSEKPPLHQHSLFSRGSEFIHLHGHNIDQLAQLIIREADQKRADFIRQRDIRLNDIIQALIEYALSVQQLRDYPGWSRSDACLLPLAWQLWLEPQRSQQEPELMTLRESGDWIKTVTETFAGWLQNRINRQTRTSALQLANGAIFVMR